jgi:beta-lactamase superfamily II metal-dependent hydrolase
MPERELIEDEDLIFHILNVGDGDNIIVEFPKNESTDERFYGIVDCYDAEKTIGYMEMCRAKRSARKQLEFICATHPHKDHIDGIDELLQNPDYKPKVFWDSGFRHSIQRYYNILKLLVSENVPMLRVSSGMERYFGKIQVSVLAPSVALRNRYGTYGVDVNNASIVLRFENHREDVLTIRSMEYMGDESLELVRDANPAVVILTGDAEFDSWSYIVEEYPRLERTSKHKPLVKKMLNFLKCKLVKVPHHGSMHSAPLDIYEKMEPEFAVISARQEESESQKKNIIREMFPHESALIALEESGAEVLTTEGSFDFIKDATGKRVKDPHAQPGSVVVVVPPGKKPRWIKLDDKENQLPSSIPDLV